MNISDEEMSPILLDELMQGRAISVDLFVRLSGNNYVLLAKCGGSVTTANLERYRGKLQYMWVRRSDYTAFNEANVEIMCKLSTDNKFPTKKRISFLVNAVIGVMTAIRDMGLRPNSFKLTKKIAKHVVLLAAKESIDIPFIIQALLDFPPSMDTHPCAVALVSVSLAKLSGWAQSSQLELLAWGALLHDIGKTQQVEAYQSHPERGAKMLAELGDSVPSELLAIVSEHHECRPDIGFPRKITDPRIHPQARIVALANQFVNLTLTDQDVGKRQSPQAAINYIETEMGQPYNRQVFATLKKVIETPTYKVS